MAGKATGERIPGRKYRAIAEASAQGDKIDRIARNLKLSWPTVKAVVERESRQISDRKQELLETSIRIAQRAANRLEDHLDEANLNQTNAIYGTATDKIGQLSGDPALIIRHEHQHLHAHQHHFQPITRETWDAILDALPDALPASPEQGASQSTPATPIDSSFPQINKTTDNQDTEANGVVAADAVPVTPESAPVTHSHSQPASDKKD